MAEKSGSYRAPFPCCPGNRVFSPACNADLSRADISASDFKTLNGKKIGVLMGTEPEVMLAEWEEKYGLKTEHVNISNNEDVKQKLAGDRECRIWKNQ